MTALDKNDYGRIVYSRIFVVFSIYDIATLSLSHVLSVCGITSCCISGLLFGISSNGCLFLERGVDIKTPRLDSCNTQMVTYHSMRRFTPTCLSVYGKSDPVDMPPPRRVSRPTPL